MATEGLQHPKPITARSLSMGDIRLVDADGNLLTDRTQAAYLPVYANVEAEATVDLDGVYAVGNNNPDNVGIVSATNAVAPADINQTVRLTGGASATTITSNTFHGLDTRSKLYGVAGLNEQELLAVTLGGADYGLGVGIFNNSGNRWEITADGYGLVDPLTIRGNEDLPASDGGAQTMLEGLSGQKAAVDLGDAVRAVGNLHGELVTAGHTWATNSNRSEEISPLDQKYVGPETLVAGAQTVTANWVDFGAEISCSGYNTIGLWLDMTINNTNDFRVRVLAKHTSGGVDEYVLPIETISSSDVKIEDEYAELNDDANQKILLKVLVDNIIPYVQFQIEAGIVGAPAATVVASTTRGWR